MASVYTMNHLRVLRVLYDNNRFTMFTGLTVEKIIQDTVEQYESIKGEKENKPLTVPTARRVLRKLVEDGLINEGIKVKIYQKTYFITETGVDFIQKMAEASQELKDLNNKKR